MPNTLERWLTNLGENVEIVLPSVATLRTLLCTNGKYKACIVAWAEELSALFFVKLKQRQLPVFAIFGENL